MSNTIKSGKHPQSPANAAKFISELVNVHGNFYTLTKTGKSGASHKMRAFAVSADNRIEDITWWIGALLQTAVYDDCGQWQIRRNGGGMDMGEDLMMAVKYACQKHAYPLAKTRHQQI